MAKETGNFINSMSGMADIKHGLFFFGLDYQFWPGISGTATSEPSVRRWCGGVASIVM